MKVIKAFPPNYAEIRRAFPYVRGRDIIFAFGDTVFNPCGRDLGPALIAHEGVHCGQQAGDPLGWWRWYLTDATFRLDQEVAAHRAEYRVLLETGGSKRDLDRVVDRLCSPLYGADLTFDRALALVAS